MSALGVGQKPIVMPHYPHMLSEDNEVWSRYLTNPLQPISELWYDVHIGQGLLLPVGTDRLIQRISRGVNRKRIDVVCLVQGEYWVVEIKPRASMTALGQALAYCDLFREEFLTARPVCPVVICDQVDPDLISVYNHHKVGLIVND